MLLIDHLTELSYFFSILDPGTLFSVCPSLPRGSANISAARAWRHLCVKYFSENPSWPSDTSRANMFSDSCTLRGTFIILWVSARRHSQPQEGSKRLTLKTNTSPAEKINTGPPPFPSVPPAHQSQGPVGFWGVFPQCLCCPWTTAWIHGQGQTRCGERALRYTVLTATVNILVSCLLNQPLPVDFILPLHLLFPHYLCHCKWEPSSIFRERCYMSATAHLLKRRKLAQHWSPFWTMKWALVPRSLCGRIETFSEHLLGCLRTPCLIRTATLQN